MKATIEHHGKSFNVDLLNPIDISIPIKPDPTNMKAWYLDTMSIEPVEGDGFVGAVAQGGSVNFRNIWFNPHGHGTHTECLGHITKDVHSVNQHIKQFFWISELISIKPMAIGEDQIITLEQVKEALNNQTPEAIIIRTIPNNKEKLSRQYSATNPAYIDVSVAMYLKDIGVRHILIDTPSVDREEDNGELLAHHAFWNVPENPRFDCSITELIYVPEEVEDGSYLLNLSFASFENDASPSKPLLFRIEK